MLMIPAEKNSFKLHTMKLPSASTDRILKIGAATTQSRKTENKSSLGTAANPMTFITSENNLAR
jgi:hypothetical protein